MKARIMKKRKRREFEQCADWAEENGNGWRSKPERRLYLNGLTMAWHKYMKKKAWRRANDGCTDVA